MARRATTVGDAGKARRRNNRQTGTLSSVAAVLRKLLHERSHKPAASQKQLAEALEQQAATAEVLKVISGSTLELPAALNIVVESACRLCEADIGTIRFEEGDRYRLAATYGCQPEWHKHFAGYSGKPDETSVFGQTIIKGRTGHIRDALKDRNYGRPQAQNLMGLRAALGVPLVRGAPGKFTEFRIVLPRAAASIAKTGERT